MVPRWATPNEFDPQEHSPAKTLSGRPAHWAAIVIKEAVGTGGALGLVMLGEPRGSEEGLGEALTVMPTYYEAYLPDSTWLWRRQGESIVLLRHGLEYARVLEASCPAFDTTPPAPAHRA